MADVFISYSNEDWKAVEKLIARVVSAGFTVWWMPHVKLREEWDDAVERELDAAKAVLVIWTPNSVKSKWVKREALAAESRQKLLPVRLQACELPWTFDTIQTADLTKWNGSASHPQWAQVITCIKTLMDEAAAASEGSAAAAAPEGSAVAAVVAANHAPAQRKRSAEQVKADLPEARALFRRGVLPDASFVLFLFSIVVPALVNFFGLPALYSQFPSGWMAGAVVSALAFKGFWVFGVTYGEVVLTIAVSACVYVLGTLVFADDLAEEIIASGSYSPFASIFISAFAFALSFLAAIVLPATATFVVDGLVGMIAIISAVGSLGDPFSRARAGVFLLSTVLALGFIAAQIGFAAA